MMDHLVYGGPMPDVEKIAARFATFPSILSPGPAGPPRGIDLNSPRRYPRPVMLAPAHAFLDVREKNVPIRGSSFLPPQPGHL
jgi:hypothetical protein